MTSFMEFMCFFKNHKFCHTQLKHFLCRVPLNRLRRNDLGIRTASTRDEEVFMMLGESFANNFMNSGIMEHCGDHKEHGVFHGSEVDSHDGALMDYLYFKHNVFMVGVWNSA